MLGHVQHSHPGLRYVIFIIHNLVSLPLHRIIHLDTRALTRRQFLSETIASNSHTKIKKVKAQRKWWTGLLIDFDPATRFVADLQACTH